MQLSKRRTPQLIAQIVALVLVAWGVVHSSRQAADQLATQQKSLLAKADQLEVQALESQDVVERESLQAQAKQLRKQAQTFWQASPLWLVLSGATYAAGMLVAGLYWQICLRRLEQPAPTLLTLWAYSLGQLGKYFPGKAMVLVLRVGTLAPLGVLKMATTITIFMETLTMMAVGGALAAICLICLRIAWPWTAMAAGLLVVTLVPILPPVLREALRRTQSGIAPEKLEAWLARVDWTQFGIGLGMLGVTWLAYGTSLYCVLRACPSAEFAATSAATIGLSSLGACALAVVLGFVSFLPGGAGVREVVLSMVLSPIVGPIAAIAAAVWLRIVWLSTEVLMVAGLWLFRKCVGDTVTPLRNQSDSSNQIVTSKSDSPD